MSNIFWENVRQHLDMRGVNWSWLRDRIGGKAASSMSNMLKTWPRLDDAMRIAEALEAPIETLYYSKKLDSFATTLAIRELASEIAELDEDDRTYIRVVIGTLRWKNKRHTLNHQHQTKKERVGDGGV